VGKKSEAPPPPDYGPLIAASERASEKAYAMSDEQFAWAKQAYAENKQITDLTTTAFLDAMEYNNENARKDRARYESVYQPLEDALVADATSFASEERKATEMGRAQAEVGQQFDAARQNAQRDLEAYGINPSATRYAALDIGVRTAEGAAKAAAATEAARNVDETARNLRAQAIDIGRGYPGQSLAAGSAAGAAGGQAGSTALGQTASGVGAMGTSAQYAGLGSGALGTAGNLMNQGYENALGAYEANQSASSGVGSLIGTVAGAALGGPMGASIGTKLFGAADGGLVPTEASPTRGVVTDDVPAQLSAGEFVIPADAVKWFGEKHMHGLIEKANRERGETPMTSGAIPHQAALPLG
jgi:ubiquitin